MHYRKGELHCRYETCESLLPSLQNEVGLLRSPFLELGDEVSLHFVEEEGNGLFLLIDYVEGNLDEKIGLRLHLPHEVIVR